MIVTGCIHVVLNLLVTASLAQIGGKALIYAGRSGNDLFIGVGDDVRVVVLVRITTIGTGVFGISLLGTSRIYDHSCIIMLLGQLRNDFLVGFVANTTASGLKAFFFLGSFLHDFPFSPAMRNLFCNNASAHNAGLLLGTGCSCAGGVAGGGFQDFSAGSTRLRIGTSCGSAGLMAGCRIQYGIAHRTRLCFRTGCGGTGLVAGSLIDQSIANGTNCINGTRSICILRVTGGRNDFFLFNNCITDRAVGAGRITFFGTSGCFVLASDRSVTGSRDNVLGYRVVTTGTNILGIAGGGTGRSHGFTNHNVVHQHGIIGGGEIKGSVQRVLGTDVAAIHIQDEVSLTGIAFVSYKLQFKNQASLCSAVLLIILECRKQRDILSIGRTNVRTVSAGENITSYSIGYITLFIYFINECKSICVVLQFCLERPDAGVVFECYSDSDNITGLNSQGIIRNGSGSCNLHCHLERCPCISSNRNSCCRYGQNNNQKNHNKSF